MGLAIYGRDGTKLFEEMYGDFAPINGMLVQHNLMATTGGYCGSSARSRRTRAAKKSVRR